MSPVRPEISLEVQFALADGALPARRLLRKWALAAAERNVEVTLRCVGTHEGRTLNLTYRGMDHATNVLSFVYDNEQDVVRGDIVLCIPVLKREAKSRHTSIEAHCAHLVVHGMLHLQGYDHENEREASLMETRETAILAGLGFADPYVPRVPPTPRAAQ